MRAPHLKATCPVCSVELAFSWITTNNGKTVELQLTDHGQDHIENHYQER